MKIQLNTDNNLTLQTEYSTKIDTLLSDKLRWFSQQISRLEVHLADENGHKTGRKDKRCIIEARLEGLKPVAVTGHGSNYDLAIDEAIDKLTSSLDTILGKLSSR